MQRLIRLPGAQLSGFCALALGALLLQPVRGVEPAPENPAPAAAAEERSDIDLVICLDTSNSMDGLIEAAKLKLWDIVSVLASAKPTPRLRVALYSFGNDGYSGEGWVRRDVEFTDDLDLIYEKLNALTTNGGNEYVARVVREATRSLEWTPGDRALKMIFVAGNEPATQDPKFPVLDVAKEAVSKGIVVNTIYCGAPTDADAQSWRKVAAAADGEFAVIDQNEGTVVISTPMDQRLAELSSELNTTYVGYGARAEEARERQVAQDSNAAAASASTGAARAVAKSSKLYSNASWDLVDASEKPDFDLSKIPDEQLPEPMRGKSLEEKQAYVREMSERRKAIQAEIQKLATERKAYIAEQKKAQAVDEDRSLDKAMKDTLRKKAAEKNIEIE